jgi:hypothetical protein
MCHTAVKAIGDLDQSHFTQSSMKIKSVAFLWEVRLRKPDARLEFKMVLLARSDALLHCLRLMGSILGDLRQTLIADFWNPGSNPDSDATLKTNALVRIFAETSWLI